jgi:hypothetical protein
VFNTTFNNISAISWRFVLFVQENGVPGENNIPAETHWQTLNNKSPKLCVRNLINLFSPWYSWKIAELALSNNHSLTILRCEFVPRSGEVYSIPHYVIKFVSLYLHSIKQKIKTIAIIQKEFVKLILQ